MTTDTDPTPPLPDDVPGEHVYVETNGVRLHAVQAGPEDGPLVVLLHGFPEFWYAWHEHVRPLANAGFRVLALDQRGYNLSDKPDGVDAYRLEELAADVVGVIDDQGYERAHLVGHDWGAGVAWWIALHHPDRVDRLAVMNVPHPAVFRRSVGRSWEQRFRSVYMVYFQIPAIPERLAKIGDWRPVVRTMRRTSRPGTFTNGDFERYREAWSQPGAFTAMLNWYRALFRRRPEPSAERVVAPTLVLWGARDQFLDRSMAWDSADFCADGRVAFFEDATHWLHHEEPVRVADRVVEFLTEPTTHP